MSQPTQDALGVQSGRRRRPKEAASSAHSQAHLVMRPRHELLGRHPLILKLMEKIRLFANERFPVLILGEPGTGKELVADALHALSRRARMPFIKVPCTAVPETLFESAMFGFEKGSFTGALETRPGHFELAEGGSLFLDEIGDLSPVLQCKLLRVMQDGEFMRVGGRYPMYADARIVAATNRDLEALQREGTFREDLYHRLKVLTIFAPPLRDHIKDIEIYTPHFLALARPERPKSVTKEALDLLLRYSWPGNVRELENALYLATVMSGGDLIDAETISEALRSDPKPVKIRKSGKKQKIEESQLRRVLDETKGNIQETAKRLDVCRNTIYKRMRECQIPLRRSMPDWKDAPSSLTRAGLA